MWAPAASSSRSAPARRSVSEIGTTESSGANRAASVAQFATTLAGATTRNGAMPGFCSRTWQINASDWTVLPRPMSSARIPPSPWAYRVASHENPSA